jgi:LacI family transcriptional regulator
VRDRATASTVPTLIDIARETRTSVSTVSRVLAGGAPAQRISRATRDKVIEAARRMGYRPNLLARSLRTRRSNTVALLVSDIANPWFGQIASLVEQNLHRHGYSLMLCNSGEDAEVEAEYLRLLPQKGIDGLIVVPLVRTKKALYDLFPAKLPVVVLDRPIPGVVTTVYSDQDQQSKLLCDTLMRVGVKEVALVAGPQHVVTHRRRAEYAAQCFRIVSTHEGPAQKETGRQAFIKFMELPQPPHAVVCTNNFLAQGLIDSIEHAENPPIVGSFDEIPMMHLLPLPIVCSVQDVPMLAEGCVRQLLPQLRGDTAWKPEPIVLDSRAVTNLAFQKLGGSQQ